MNNYKLHEKAQELSDSKSAYKLARELLQANQTIKDLQDEVIALHKRDGVGFC